METPSFINKLLRACGLVLLIFNILTILPSNAIGDDFNMNNSAHRALSEAIDAELMDQLPQAKRSYEQAIREVIRNKDVEVLFIAKTRLANIIAQQDGDQNEIRLLQEQAEDAISSLGQRRDPPTCDNNCPAHPDGTPREKETILGVEHCLKCPPPD